MSVGLGRQTRLACAGERNEYDSSGDARLKTESNSTRIQVKQVSIFPSWLRLKGLSVVSHPPSPPPPPPPVRHLPPSPPGSAFCSDNLRVSDLPPAARAAWNRRGARCEMLIRNSLRRRRFFFQFSSTFACQGNFIKHVFLFEKSTLSTLIRDANNCGDGRK